MPNQDSNRVDRALEDIIADIYAKLYIHDAYIGCLHAFINSLVKMFVDDDHKAMQIKQSFKYLVNEEIEKVKKQNSLLDDIAIEKAMREIKGIPGIELLNNDTD